LRHGLVDPKTLGNSLQKKDFFDGLFLLKGKKINISLPNCGDDRALLGASGQSLVTKMNFDNLLVNILERVFFSFSFIRTPLYTLRSPTPPFGVAVGTQRQWNKIILRCCLDDR